MKYAAAVLLLTAGLLACSDYGIRVPERLVDQWLVEGNVDLVVVGDTSDSMADTLTTLTDNFHRFVTRLEEAQANWHLIAVTGPDGCAQGGVLTETTTDWESVFTAGITTKPNEDLVDEWGLHNAAKALAESRPGGCNEGFLRKEAQLHVVFVSDEDDNSPGWDSGEADYWVPYVTDLLASKSDESKVHLTAVGGPAPTGCSFADFARGYWEAVEATGGDFLSICGDWVFELEALADEAVVRTSFPLSEDPDASSIQLFVNSLERIDGWTYRSVGNAITFEEDAPYVGQVVQARYTTRP